MARHHMTPDGPVSFTSSEEATRDVKEQLWADGTIARNASKEVARLESTVTNRRVREAIAGTDAGWLANVESLIAIERGKL
jgi:hypothetical protein